MDRRYREWPAAASLHCCPSGCPPPLAVDGPVLVALTSRGAQRIVCVSQPGWILCSRGCRSGRPGWSSHLRPPLESHPSTEFMGSPNVDQLRYWSSSRAFLLEYLLFVHIPFGIYSPTSCLLYYPSGLGVPFFNRKHTSIVCDF